MSLVIISPHLDDAVLSCGQLMAGRSDVKVITVFAGKPKNADTSLTSYDETCGFKHAKEAVDGRRYEDREAMGILRAEYAHLDYIDGQYKQDNDWLMYTTNIRTHVHDAEQVLLPLGINHPDHIDVRNRTFEALLGTGKDILFYEELPSRILWPEDVPPLLLEADQLMDQTLKLRFIGDGELADKLRAVNCYRSQLGVIDQKCIVVGERFWGAAL